MEAVVAKYFKPDKVDEFNKRVNLVKDLTDNKFNTADELHAAHGDLVTRSQAEGIIQKISKTQKGGAGGDDFFSATIAGAIDGLVSIFIPEVRIPVRTVLSMVFLLNYIEKLPMFGSLVGAALDITAAALPVTAVNIQTAVPALVGLIPLPYMNFVGMGLGWFFSATLLFLAITIGISRMQFGAAIEASAGLIPVFGAAAMNFVRTSNMTMGRMNARRQKVVAEFLEVVETIKTVATELSEDAKNTLNEVAGEAVRAVENFRQPVPASAPAQAPAPVGGKKRLSSRRRVIKKWKTTRRIKSVRR